jgi:GT2 family glycosyltransferase
MTAAIYESVSLIIPCYFVDESFVKMTEKCIQSIETKGDHIDELIIVDDGSPYEVPDFEQEGIIFVKRDTNGGYAAAVNSGLNRATGDTIIICNNDIEFIQPDWLSHLLKPLKEGYDIASIRTTDCDGWITDDYLSEGDKFGSIWAMKRNVYNSVGGLDESFGKGYFEDLDYQKRAEDAGFKVGKNHAGLVHHVGKATFSVVDTDDRSYRTAMEVFRKKHGKVW